MQAVPRGGVVKHPSCHNPVSDCYYTSATGGAIAEKVDLVRPPTPTRSLGGTGIADDAEWCAVSHGPGYGTRHALAMTRDGNDVHLILFSTQCALKHARRHLRSHRPRSPRGIHLRIRLPPLTEFVYRRVPRMVGEYEVVRSLVGYRIVFKKNVHFQSRWPGDCHPSGEDFSIFFDRSMQSSLSRRVVGEILH